LNPDGLEGDESSRVEELLRVNAELAAEIRSLSLGRAGEPRSAATPAVRRVARAVADRDEAVRKLEAAEAELAHLEQHNSELRDLVEDQRRQIDRLRSGAAGFARRLRMRLQRR
jgi:predicted RNase H-like nuclease (RuvC/YqgF family)